MQQPLLDYYPELIKFIDQAKSGKLGTVEYEKSYGGLMVKVSFGQGNQARVPWIAFLSEFDKVPDGIYPVYLFYKGQNLLILAYGLSETNKPKRSWNVEGIQTIDSFFEEHSLGKPVKYGSSLVYESYDLSEPLDSEKVNNDLNTLIDIYKNTYQNMAMKPNYVTDPGIEGFYDSAVNAGYFIQRKFVYRFYASLLTKPFVILTGLSGSGKTKLAQAFVQWICKNKSQYCIVPVGADWTNREPLLGYPNALQPGGYVKPDSGVLDLILEANANPEAPYFLILDEMNLSHVERYFADFLSVMESKEQIPLFGGGGIEQNVPSSLKIPSNLFIIGTVNIDETTNMFSPKVLDRANTIEFRVSQKEMENFLSGNKQLNLDGLTAKGADTAKAFLTKSRTPRIENIRIDEITQELVKFFGELKKVGAEFGYRSASEILRLVQFLEELDSRFTLDERIDIAIIQKLLPKLHGSRRKLTPVLEALGKLCIRGDYKIISDVFEKADFDFNDEGVRYPLSLEKITRMYNGAIDNGFTSFAEA